MKKLTHIKKNTSLFLLTSAILFNFSYAFAWGKRGHETVGSLAARLLAEKQPEAQFLSNHSYDMGFYNNVPDIVWKSEPKTFKKEHFQHFMDMEHFKNVKETDWVSQRESFFKKFPNIGKKSGRAWWRVNELNTDLEKITQSLKQKKLPIKEQHNYQAKWLLYAGVMGHYIADLAQPLHVTANYDGKKTKQRGIHRWFEEEVIDELYPSLHEEVYKQALQKWDSFHNDNKSKDVFQLCQELTKNSQDEINNLLSIDKKVGRKNLKKAAEAFKQLAVDRLAIGTLYLAEIWSRQTNWDYNGVKFYKFDSKPNYIEPTKY